MMLSLAIVAAHLIMLYTVSLYFVAWRTYREGQTLAHWLLLYVQCLVFVLYHCIIIIVDLYK